MMACHLVGAKPLSEPMLKYCQLDPWEQTSGEILIEINIFVQEIWKCCLWNGGYLVLASMC